MYSSDTRSNISDISGRFSKVSKRSSTPTSYNEASKELKPVNAAARGGEVEDLVEEDEEDFVDEAEDGR